MATHLSSNPIVLGWFDMAAGAGNGLPWYVFVCPDFAPEIPRPVATCRAVEYVAVLAQNFRFALGRGRQGRGEQRHVLCAMRQAAPGQGQVL